MNTDYLISENKNKMKLENEIHNNIHNENKKLKPLIY
jgi:hypothetical protein